MAEVDQTTKPARPSLGSGAPPVIYKSISSIDHRNKMAIRESTASSRACRTQGSSRASLTSSTTEFHLKRPRPRLLIAVLSTLCRIQIASLQEELTRIDSSQR